VEVPESVNVGVWVTVCVNDGERVLVWDKDGDGVAESVMEGVIVAEVVTDGVSDDVDENVEVGV
jgi:hypothetical protein